MFPSLAQNTTQPVIIKRESVPPHKVFEFCAAAAVKMCVAEGNDKQNVCIGGGEGRD